MNTDLIIDDDVSTQNEGIESSLLTIQPEIRSF